MKPLLPLIMKPLICSEELLSRSLTGKTIIVTGGNSGIGYETVKQLAKQGAEVILACRRLDSGEHAKQSILAECPNAIVEVMELDLASLSSIRAFAQHFLDQGRPLHVLVNNAGVMNTARGKTEDGFELQFGTNHLGHFLLTELLLPALRTVLRLVLSMSLAAFTIMQMVVREKFILMIFILSKGKYDGWEGLCTIKAGRVLHAQGAGRSTSGQWGDCCQHSSGVGTHEPGEALCSFVGAERFCFGQFLFNWNDRAVHWCSPTTLYTILSDEVASQSGAFSVKLECIVSEKQIEEDGPSYHRTLLRTTQRWQSA